MHFEPEFFVAVGFVLFICLLLFLGVHKTIVGGIDARSQRIEDFVARRTRQAETKIALAETQATADVRAAAADAAARAAEVVLKAETVGQAAADLVSKEIAGLKARLN